jgi:predicted transcriptional regulator
MGDLPELATRRHIVEFVVAHPGASAREIQRALSLGWGETAYHLNQLIRDAKVERDRAGWRDYYFAPSFPPRDRRLLAALQSPAERSILVALSRHPDQTVSEIAENVALGRSTLAFHLRVLLSQDLVGFVFRDGVRRYRAGRAEQVLELCRNYRDSWGDKWADEFSRTFGGIGRE